MTSNRNAKPLSAKEKFTKATAAMIAVGALSLAACSSGGPSGGANGGGVPTAPLPTAAETVEPTTEPSPEATPEAPANFGYTVLTRSPIPDDLVKYQEMSPDDFEKLPKAEQWKYAEYLTQYRDEFIEVFSGRSGSRHNKVSQIAPEDGGMQFMAYHLYTLRMALYSTKGAPTPTADGTCGPVDMDAVRKILLAGSESRVYYLNSVDAITNVGDSLCIEQQVEGRAFPVEQYENAEVTERGVEEYQGQKVDYVWVNYLDRYEQREYSFKFYIYPVDTENGQEYRTILNRHGEPAN